jgi:hypothetical protein
MDLRRGEWVTVVPSGPGRAYRAVVMETECGSTRKAAVRREGSDLNHEVWLGEIQQDDGAERRYAFAPGYDGRDGAVYVTAQDGRRGGRPHDG